VLWVVSGDDFEFVATMAESFYAQQRSRQGKAPCACPPLTFGFPCKLSA